MFRRAKAIREKKASDRYVVDSLRLILSQLGVTITPYNDLIHPIKEDQRDPMVIAKENAERMGIKVVSK